MAITVETAVTSVEIPIAPDRRRQDRVRTRLPIRILSIDGSPAMYPGHVHQSRSRRRGIRTLPRESRSERSSNSNL